MSPNNCFSVAGIILILLSFSSQLIAQVDVTRYASEELFKINPIVNHNQINTSKIETTSWFEDQLQKGMDYWLEGNSDDALYIFENILDESPEIAFLHFYTGSIYFEKERYQEAKESFTATLKHDPLLLEAKYMLGLISIEEKDHKAAKSHFKTLISIPLYKAYGYHGIGLLSMAEGYPYNAYKNFKRCIDADSSFLEAYIPMITIDLFLGKLKSARKIVEKALTLNDKWEQGIIIRGMISLMQDKNTDQFEKDINTLIQIAPENYHYYSMKGFLKMELGNYKEAVLLFRIAYNLEVDSTRAGEFKFSSRLSKEEAIQRSLNYYFEKDDISSEAKSLIDRGICEYIAGEREKALVLFDSANLMEENPVSYTFKGSIYKNRFGDNRMAIENFTNAIKQDSLNWIAYSYRGEEHMEFGNLKSALEDFSKVIELKPKAKEGYKNRGIILLEKGYPQLAYKDFSFGIAMDTTDSDMFFNRAVAAMNLGFHNNAENDLRFIIKKNPEDGEAYYLLHKCRINAGDSLGAISSLDSASKLTKYKRIFHKELLELASSMGLQEKCLEAHNRLVKYSSGTNDRLNRAKYLFERGEYEMAIEDLNKVIDRKKTSGEAYYYLGSALLKLGNEKDSKKYLKKAEKFGYKGIM